MKIVDANIILRYLLNDNEELTEKAAELLEKCEVYIPNEITAEVVYVLEKVYKVSREEISNILNDLFSYSTIIAPNKRIILEALSLFRLRKLDFVDTLLYAYNKVGHHTIITFDEKLNKLLE